MGVPAVSHKKRLLYTMLGIGVCFMLLIGRLFYLQIIKGEELSEMAESQQTKDTELSAARGKITDSNGVVLAQSGTAYKVLVWPNQINGTERERERIARELSELLDLDYETVLSKVSDTSKQEIVLKRSVERETIDKITALKLGNGVGTAIDNKRYYPMSNLFCQLIGFTTVDSVGQSGIEQKYDKYLAGVEGRMITETDRKGNALAYGTQEIIEATDGYDVVLTTDSVVESFLEKALKEALEVNNAESAQGIIMNCKTGEIVAISTQPDFDLNDPPRDDIQTLNSLMRNRIATDAYEPGSTFKVVTLAAALDSGTVNESTVFDCKGQLIVNGEKIRCWKSGGHGTQTLEKAVQNSCNPAFMRMALNMGRETFYDYIYAFGFGSSTGSGIGGEASGIVTHEKYVNENTLARIGFGQSIAITPLQLTTAVSAAVNGGNLMQPYVVKRIVSQSGETILENEPTMVRRVISEKTSETVRRILESVVSEGGGKNAAIPGYRIGGKTGTAQKYENGEIADGKLIASFIGFAPADDPEYVCLILVDEPKVGVVFGSTVAAPFVKDVMAETLRHYGYLPETGEETVTVPNVVGMSVDAAKYELEKAGLTAVAQETDDIIAQIPAAGETAVKGSQVLLYTALTNEVQNAQEELPDTVTVPNIIGLTRLEASDRLEYYGLEILIEPYDQTGTAIRQVPAAGTEVEAGSQVMVDFSNVNLGE